MRWLGCCVATVALSSVLYAASQYGLFPLFQEVGVWLPSDWSLGLALLVASGFGAAWLEQAFLESPLGLLFAFLGWYGLTLAGVYLLCCLPYQLEPSVILMAVPLAGGWLGRPFAQGLLSK
jgi:hypothetical protein